MTPLVDTHCHVDRAYYPDGPDVALDRARAAGIAAFVAIGVGETLEAPRYAAAVAARRPDVFAAVGLHPHDAKVMSTEWLGELEALLDAPRVVALGEIGLDYHYMHSDKEQQRNVFGALIALAKQKRKPIVVHTRSAAADTLEILEAEGARDVGGIIHCFSEDRAFAERALDLDFDLSFSGIVTFKNARAVQDVATWAPEDRILIETDSPYLAPVPFRGKTCEPAHIVHTAAKVASLRGVDIDALAEATTKNASRRLGLAIV
ncbi:MAG TPA: TatD family hydrolase [Polyangiaceae bacterium]|jgi:TatD DNase family protein|nr:TatD family hydrolase [Polyangiaceae bacterium]